MSLVLLHENVSANYHLMVSMCLLQDLHSWPCIGNVSNPAVLYEGGRT